MIDLYKLKNIGIMKIAISLLFGSITSITFGIYYLFLQTSSPYKLVFFLIYLAIIFSLFFYHFFYQYIFPKLSFYPKRVRILWIIICLVAGGYLFFAIPIKSPPAWYPSQATLVIETTGEHNPLAKGNEVWLNLYDQAGKVIPLDEFKQKGNWMIEDGAIVSRSGTNNELLWTEITTKPYTLVFSSHPWSGIINLTWGNYTQRIDLYSDKNTEKVINLKVQTKQPIWFTLVLVTSIGITIGVIFLYISLLLASAQWKKTNIRKKSKPIIWITYSIPMILIWGLYLLIYWPGLISSDVFDQWNQMMHWNVNDAHPAFHTFTLWFLSLPWRTPGLVAATQVIALGLLSGYGFSRIERLGIKKRIIWLCVTFMALIPANIMLVISLYKDIPFSIVMVAITFIIFLVVTSEGKWLFDWKNVALSGIVIALGGLYRHNGLPIGIFSLIILGVGYKKYAKSIIAILVISFLIWLGIRGPIYDLAHVNKAGVPSLPYFIFPYLASHENAGTKLTVTESTFLNNALPNDGYKSYQCETTVPIIFNSSLNRQFIENNSNRLVSLFIDLTLRNPKATFSHFFCANSMVWRIIPLKTDIFHTIIFFKSDRGITTLAEDPYNTGIRQANFSSVLQQIFSKPIFVSLQSTLLLILWRPAFYIYISFFLFAIISIRRRDARYMFIGLPALMNSIIMLMVIPSPDFRYQYFLVPATLLYFPLLFLDRKIQ